MEPQLNTSFGKPIVLPEVQAGVTRGCLSRPVRRASGAAHQQRHRELEREPRVRHEQERRHEQRRADGHEERAPPDPVREEAEDLVSDTMLRAFERWRQFELGSNIRAWLFRILKNQFLNRVDVCAAFVSERSLADPGLARVVAERALGCLKRFGQRLRIGPIEAIDGTPVVDIKPVLR